MAQPDRMVAEARVAAQAALCSRRQNELTAAALRLETIWREGQEAAATAGIMRVVLRAARRDGCSTFYGFGAQQLSRLARRRATERAHYRRYKTQRSVMRRISLRLVAGKVELAKMNKEYRREFCLTPPRPTRQMRNG